MQITFLYVTAQKLEDYREKTTKKQKTPRH